MIITILLLTVSPTISVSHLPYPAMILPLATISPTILIIVHHLPSPSILDTATTLYPLLLHAVLSSLMNPSSLMWNSLMFLSISLPSTMFKVPSTMLAEGSIPRYEYPDLLVIVASYR